MPELILVSIALSDLEYCSPGWDAGPLQATSAAAADVATQTMIQHMLYMRVESAVVKGIC